MSRRPENESAPARGVDRLSLVLAAGLERASLGTEEAIGAKAHITSGKALRQAYQKRYARPKPAQKLGLNETAVERALRSRTEDAQMCLRVMDKVDTFLPSSASFLEMQAILCVATNKFLAEIGQFEEADVIVMEQVFNEFIVYVQAEEDDVDAPMNTAAGMYDKDLGQTVRVKLQEPGTFSLLGEYIENMFNIRKAWRNKDFRATADLVLAVGPVLKGLILRWVETSVNAPEGSAREVVQSMKAIYDSVLGSPAQWLSSLTGGTSQAVFNRPNAAAGALAYVDGTSRTAAPIGSWMVGKRLINPLNVTLFQSVVASVWAGANTVSPQVRAAIYLASIITRTVERVLSFRIDAIAKWNELNSAKAMGSWASQLRKRNRGQLKPWDDNLKAFAEQLKSITAQLEPFAEEQKTLRARMKAIDKKYKLARRALQQQIDAAKDRRDVIKRRKVPIRANRDAARANRKALNENDVKPRLKKIIAEAELAKARAQALKKAMKDRPKLSRHALRALAGGEAEAVQSGASLTGFKTLLQVGPAAEIVTAAGQVASMGVYSYQYFSWMETVRKKIEDVHASIDDLHDLQTDLDNNNVAPFRPGPNDEAEEREEDEYMLVRMGPEGDDVPEEDYEDEDEDEDEATYMLGRMGPEGDDIPEEEDEDEDEDEAAYMFGRMGPEGDDVPEEDYED